MNNIFPKYTIKIFIFFGLILCFCSCNKSNENLENKSIRNTENLNNNSFNNPKIETKSAFLEKGIASWYGYNFHGKISASGEICNIYEMTASHNSLPFGSIVKVTDIAKNNFVIVRINDRGPSINKRIINLSRTAAEKLNIIESGLAKVKIELIKN